MKALSLLISGSRPSWPYCPSDCKRKMLLRDVLLLQQSLGKYVQKGLDPLMSEFRASGKGWRDGGRPRLAIPGACYRGPKPQKCPKSLGEGAKGLLGPWRQSLLALVQKRVAPVQNGVWVVQKTLGRPLLLGSKTPFAPSPNHFGHFRGFGPLEQALGVASQDNTLRHFTTFYDSLRHLAT